jgi:Clp amino terminal domain, pathogenicity island component
VITLEIADLVVIASRTLGLDTGQVLALLDVAAAEQALAQPRPGSDPGDPAGPAAALLHALVGRRPLPRGNQQVALAAMLQFLALNGWEMDPDPPEQVAAVVAGIVAGTLDTTTMAEWLAPRLRPSGRAAARVKEAAMRGRPAMPLAEKIKKATMRRQPKGMFQRFTDRARRVVCLAQEEARLLRHNYVGTEHLLLGLLHEGEGVAAGALASLGISLADVRGQVEEMIGHGQNPVSGHIPFTPRTKKVLELSLREALAMGHHYIGTEHLLLALLREGQGVAAQVLTRLGASHAQVRERVLGLLTGECEQQDLQAQLAADLVNAAEQLTQVRQQKEAAFDAGDLEAAAALRDREKQLLADKLRLENQLTVGAAGQVILGENQRLRHELQRLRDLLRQHGIEPDSGNARPA